MMLIVATVSIVLYVSPVRGCTMADWSASFAEAGYSSCGYLNDYINGLNRNKNQQTNYGISLIKEAWCCPCPRPYYNQPTQCVAADWFNSFDRNNTWNNCPQGMFLRGLYRSDGSNTLNDIEYGWCCKPASHPYWYGHCYEQDVVLTFDNQGTSKCNDGYFLTGLFRGNCDKLYCIEHFKCCEMYPSPPPLSSLSDVKTRVMDVTVRNLALLAHYLGYGWCAGCRGQNVGEDFIRNGDSWEADKKGPCNGYKADHRLKIHYGDFKFSIKDIKYGSPLIQTLQPETFDEGRVTNADSTPLNHRVEREIRSVRTVIHTTTSSWKSAHELGIEISYSPPGVTGGVGGKSNYKFNYETSQSNTDSSANQQYNSIKILSDKTLNSNTAANYKIMLSKSRTTVPYTATIIVHFSAELDGFLRWDGANGDSTNYHYQHRGSESCPTFKYRLGSSSNSFYQAFKEGFLDRFLRWGGEYNGDSTNCHYQHRGSGSSPTFKYRFGSSSNPFYQALKEESDRNVRPWEWSNLKSEYSSAQEIIDYLSNEGLYEFTLTGQFEDVIGQNADVQWKTAHLTLRNPSRKNL